MKAGWTGAIAALFIVAFGVARLVDAREATELVAEARSAAQTDQNAISAQLFGEALKRDPELRDSILREYADQLLYAGKASAAIPLLLETLADPDTSALDSERARRSLALAYLWSGQHAKAVAAYEQALSHLPGDEDLTRNYVEALIGAAREAARLDRNRESARLFAKAIEHAPKRREELLKEYADQLTYSERAPEAIGRYSELLSTFPLSTVARTEVRLSFALAKSWSGALADALAEYSALIAEDPENLRARKGRAEILSWMDRHEAAAAELRRALVLASGDHDLQRRLARTESYRGRHRSAISLARPLLAADPSDEEAAIITAESQRWMGRPDSALETLDALLLHRPGSGRALKLRAEILRDLRPETEVRAIGSTQSDDMEIWSAGFKHIIRMYDGMTSFGPQYQHVGYEPGSGRGVDVDRLGGFFRHRFSDAVEFNSSFFLDVQRGFNDQTIFTHNSYVTILPSDLWRIDFGASRYTLDNIQSLNMGLAVDQLSGSVDFWPTGDLKLTARGSWADYSDGNERWWAQGEGMMRFLRGPDIWFGARYTAFGFEKRLDNGYFNPDDLQSFELTFRADDTLLGDLRYEISAAAGIAPAPPP